MSDTNSLKDQVLEHKELSELVPWYINGTLPEADALRVQKHLDFCLECRSESNFLRELAQIVGEEDLQNEAVKANFLLLRQQIADRDNVQTYRNRILLKLAQLFSTFRHSESYFFPLVAALFVSALGLVFFLQEARLNERFSDNRFQTLSTTEASSSADENELFIAFQQGTSDAEIANIFLNHGLKPLSRSEDRKLWRITVNDESQENSSPLLIVDRLRSNNNVLFVERVLAED